MQLIKDGKKIIEAVCVDAKVDLSIEMPQPSEKFLMEILTGEPNYVQALQPYRVSKLLCASKHFGNHG